MEISEISGDHVTVTGERRIFHFGDGGLQNVTHEPYERTMTRQEVQELHDFAATHSSTARDIAAVARLGAIISAMEFQDNSATITDRPAARPRQEPQPVQTTFKARPPMGGGMGGL